MFENSDKKVEESTLVYSKTFYKKCADEGATEDDVITRFGVPEKSYMTHNQKYLVYDFAGIDYAFDKSNIPVVSNTQTKETGNCTGTFVIDDGIVEKLTIQGTNCQLYQIQN